MPVKIFINNKGKFTATDIPQSTGLWQTIYTADVNGDGFTDILAGNWGHNSKLYAGKNGPLKLYVKDFDIMVRLNRSWPTRLMVKNILSLPRMNWKDRYRFLKKLT